MQPEVMCFFAAIVVALVKIVQLWLVWDNREEDE